MYDIYSLGEGLRYSSGSIGIGMIDYPTTLNYNLQILNVTIINLKFSLEQIERRIASGKTLVGCGQPKSRYEQ